MGYFALAEYPWKMQIFSRAAAQDRLRHITFAEPATDQPRTTQHHCIASMYVCIAHHGANRWHGPSSSAPSHSSPLSIALQLIPRRRSCCPWFSFSAAAANAVVLFTAGSSPLPLYSPSSLHRVPPGTIAMSFPFPCPVHGLPPCQPSQCCTTPPPPTVSFVTHPHH